MGKTSISWTHFSFNSWWGCVEQGTPGNSECDNCYAKTLAKRWHGDIWGYGKPRKFQSDKYWKQPYNWNKKAEQHGERYRVFANSMSDWAEGRKDLDEPRERLFKVIEETPNLDWLLLTKLPNRITERGYLKNVWYGTSVGVNASRWRIDRLRKIESVPVRFLSIEPLLEPLPDLDLTNISWVIIGAEGIGGRPCKIEWMEDIIQQCRKQNIPVFVKQLGTYLSKELKLSDRQGGDINEFPEFLKIRQFPN